MRADMDKVLCERPRLKHGSPSGAGKGYRKQLRKLMLTEDGPPASEGIMVRNGHGKRLNENLGPLRRYIDAQVGRPWNKVHAEIAANIDAGDNVQTHILVHLYQYVERHVVLRDGVPCHAGDRGWRGGRIEGRYQWYVCPRTGLLRRAPAGSGRKAEAPRKPRQAWIAADQLLRERPGGGWELLRMRPWPEDGAPVERRRKFIDAALGKSLAEFAKADALAAYGKPWWCVAVRPLKAAELRSLPIPEAFWGKALPAPNRG